MGLFRQLLDQEGSLAHGPAAGHVGYDPRLLDSLLHDHAELGRLYGCIGAAAGSGNFDEIRLLLATFKSRFDAHLLTENLRFYNYLEQSLANDPDNLRMLGSFRKEMNAIAHDVVGFIKQYLEDGIDPEALPRFQQDYAAIGKRLEHRLDCEEDSLYRLYRPT